MPEIVPRLMSEHLSASSLKLRNDFQPEFVADFFTDLLARRRDVGERDLCPGQGPRVTPRSIPQLVQLQIEAQQGCLPKPGSRLRRSAFVSTFPSVVHLKGRWFALECPEPAMCKLG